MRTRPLGKTGLEVSELSLGTWGLSGDGYGEVSDEVAEKVIARALQLGITVYDTADVYGAGQMETALGRALPAALPRPADKPNGSGVIVPTPGAPAVSEAATLALLAPVGGTLPGVGLPPTVTPAPPPVAERPVEVGAASPGAPGAPGAAPDHKSSSAPTPAMLAAEAAHKAEAAAAGRAARLAAMNPPKPVPATHALVITKIGTDMEEGRKRFDVPYLRKAFERCSERLGRSPDVLLMHNPTRAAFNTETVAFFTELRDQKQIRAWGVSVGSVEVARTALDRGADVLELAYNVFAARDLHELAAEISSTGAGVLVRSVLSHGLLAGQWSGDREFYSGDHRTERWQPMELKRRIAQLDALRPWSPARCARCARWRCASRSPTTSSPRWCSGRARCRSSSSWCAMPATGHPTCATRP
ncbi:MAG: aldo/keto reductase [Polyangiaceae bacterium]